MPPPICGPPVRYAARYWTTVPTLVMVVTLVLTLKALRSNPNLEIWTRLPFSTSLEIPKLTLELNCSLLYTAPILLLPPYPA